MFETYSESAEGVDISHDRALRELRDHGFRDRADQARMETEFLADLGDRDTYDAQDVLRWLGY